LGIEWRAEKRFSREAFCTLASRYGDFQTGVCGIRGVMLMSTSINVVQSRGGARDMAVWISHIVSADIMPGLGCLKVLLARA
jgi:hypothetical protein